MDALREHYADLLGAQPDAQSVRLVGDLDRVYEASLPVQHDAAIAGALRARVRERKQRLARRRAAHWTRRFMILAAVLAVAAGAALAAGEIVNLGKPTNTQSTSSAFPLGGFHRVGVNLRDRGKPVLLFLGVGGVDPATSVERWPVVKALDQFGVLAGVKTLQPRCYDYRTASGIYPLCSAATFDLSHATYRSPYLRFVTKDVALSDGRSVRRAQALTPQQAALWQQYACGSSRASCPHPGQTTHEPVVAVGDYLQTDSQMMVFADFARPWPGTGVPVNTQPLSFDAIQQALQTDRDPPYTSRLVENVNGEANVITALLCHADGKRPGSVCNRPAIRSILKSVR